MIAANFVKTSPKRHLVKIAGFGLPGTITRKLPYQLYLEGISKSLARPSKRLAGYKIVVIGAGPAGLVLARSAATQGATVQVLEKADDPRVDDQGYTNRSFNLTLDDVGRAILADPRALRGGTRLRGRAIHNADNDSEVLYAEFGETANAELLSIPRPVLRQNLCSLAEEAGVELTFSVNVYDTDCDNGTVSYVDREGIDRTVRSDLITFCDGVHSLADSILKSEGALIKRWSEQRRYLSGLISPAMNDNLSIEYIHFWYEKGQENFTIGIPNADHSVACLLVSDYPDVLPGDKPFASTNISRRPRQLFSRLCQSAPGISGVLASQTCGHFWYKSVSQFRVGKHGILAGDSGGAFPPWAGFGVNQSMFSSSLLVYLLARYRRDTNKALNEYQQQQLYLGNFMKTFVALQGDFLSGPVIDDPAGRSDPALGPLIWRAYKATHKRTHTYRVSKLRLQTPLAAS